jgi:hypothetical protein
MDLEWVREEQRLWDTMMNPGKGTRRWTTHSMVPGPERNKVIAEIDKQRDKDFEGGWRGYAAWVKH